jgi:RNase P/RNase MRP subunit POP5
MSKVHRTQNQTMFFHHGSKSIYINEGTKGYQRYKVEQTRLNMAILKLDTKGLEEPDLPHDCIPADGYRNDSTAYLHFYKESPTTKVDRKQMKHTIWSSSMTRHIEIKNAMAMMKVATLKEAIIRVITDGGIHEYGGTFGVIISDGESIFAKNKGQIYSVDFHQSSYRSELFAMLAGLIMPS